MCHPTPMEDPRMAAILEFAPHIKTLQYLIAYHRGFNYIIHCYLPVKHETFTSMLEITQPPLGKKKACGKSAFLDC